MQTAANTFARGFRSGLHASAAILLASSLAAADGPGPIDTVLLVDGDDLGLQLGCYGDARAATPNIDRLARDGARFTRAYVAQPSCSPSRAAMLTGLHPHQNGMVGLAHRGFNIADGLQTLPATLAAAGWKTAAIGKVHVAPMSAFPYELLGGGMESARQDGKDWPASTRDVRKVAGTVRSYLERIGGAPVLINISFLDPHDDMRDQVLGLPEKPFLAGDVPAFPWSPTVPPAKVASYYNCVARLDAGIGLLREAVRASGRGERTLIILWGDNGPQFPRGKMTLYDAGVRTPLIMAGPGIAPGQIRPEPVYAMDAFPTILASAGIAWDPKAAASEARSLWPLLAGDPAPVDWRGTVFTEMTYHTQTQWTPMRMATDGRHALIANLEPSGWTLAGKPPSPLPPPFELYDLQSDPLQQANLIEDPGSSAVRDRLMQELHAWRKRTADPLLDPASAAAWRQIALDPSVAFATYQPPKRPK